MNTSQKDTHLRTQNYRIPLPEKDKGFFNSSMILLSPDEVFNFCQDSSNVEKVLTDMPVDVNNFLKLKLISAQKNSDQYEIKWENSPETKFTGTLAFILQKAPANHGTYLLAEAVFDQFDADEEEPSLLMKVFVKRFKALMETGVLATTKGQPSGREEIEPETKTIH